MSSLTNSWSAVFGKRDVTSTLINSLIASFNSLSVNCAAFSASLSYFPIYIPPYLNEQSSNSQFSNSQLSKAHLSKDESLKEAFLNSELLNSEFANEFLCSFVISITSYLDFPIHHASGIFLHVPKWICLS